MRRVQKTAAGAGALMKFGGCVLICCALFAGCDAERISKLEKENAELKAKVEKRDLAVDYDLQAKYAKDAKVWFSENLSQDKDTISQIYINHYNKKLNTCFIRFAYNFRLYDGSNSWNTSIWNVYENSQYADIDINHEFKDGHANNQMFECEVQGQKCHSQEEFDRLTSSFLND